MEDLKSYRGKRIVVAMSGGVDSSVTAALLAEAGAEVIGMTMRVFDYTETSRSGSCCSPDDVYDARRVADHLGIPFYLLNFEERFRRAVIDEFVAEYRRGRTPNPCIRCNEHVKFATFLERARALDAAFIATGHYARIRRTPRTGRFELLRGCDRAKDQSYFLFPMKQEQLARTLFPVGGLDKEGVRAHAERLGLPVARKADSQEICFIPDHDVRGFLEKQIDAAHAGEGEILDWASGKVVGRHKGLHGYTIGQRRGLGISAATPRYVVSIDPEGNRLFVGEKEALRAAGAWVKRVNWIARPAPETPIEAQVKIRHAHEPAPALLYPDREGGVEVYFHDPQLAVTPGQAAVFYDGDVVLGGGWIETSIPLPRQAKSLSDPRG
ncbi:MAG: tRNA 2-thiouridine(34) synthase MnmA [Deltaproteobacteria bacterium]|nr:MAG: tRNA 2-thiouridine(34) synthase MnmA [Deltaproteobacteria bacterium]